MGHADLNPGQRSGLTSEIGESLMRTGGIECVRLGGHLGQRFSASVAHGIVNILQNISPGSTLRDSDLTELMWGLDIYICPSSLEDCLIPPEWKNHSSVDKVQLEKRAHDRAITQS